MKKIRQIVSQVFRRSSREQGGRKKKATAWMRREVSLLLVGLALAGFYGATRLESYVSARAALKAFQSVEHSDASGGMSSLEEDLFEEEVRDARNAEGAYEPAAKVSPDRGTPLGVLEIPNVHLRVPLLEGTNPLTLNHGAGRIVGTARPGEGGNIGIAGHRDSFFRPLKNIKAGDPIKLKTAAGMDTYVVDGYQIVSPRDVSVLEPTDFPALTLVTCYPFYFIGNAPKRFVVTAYLTNHAPAGSTTSSPRPSNQPRNSTMEDQ